jgi:hypothetical protein
MAPTIALLKEYMPDTPAHILRIEHAERSDQFIALPGKMGELAEIWAQSGKTLHERLFDRKQDTRLYIDLDGKWGSVLWQSLVGRSRKPLEFMNDRIKPLIDYLRKQHGIVYVWTASTKRVFSVHITCPKVGTNRFTTMRKYVKSLASADEIHKIPFEAFDSCYGKGKSMRMPYCAKPIPGGLIRPLLPHAYSDPVPYGDVFITGSYDYELPATIYGGTDSDTTEADSDVEYPEDTEAPDDIWGPVADYVSSHYSLNMSAKPSRDGFYRTDSDGDWPCPVCSPNPRDPTVAHENDNACVRLVGKGFILTCFRAKDKNYKKSSHFVPYHVVLNDPAH